jgi:FecR protein
MRAILLALIISVVAFGNIGKVAASKGEATIHRGGKSISVKPNMDIILKDRLTTQKGAKVQVILKDETTITIGENSEYSFDSFSFDGTANSEASMQLKNGFFRAISGEIGKIAPKRFNIKTRSATIGILGTHFYGFIQGDEEKIGCVKGKIIVYTKIKNYIVNAGESVTLKNGLWSVTILPKAPDAKWHEHTREFLEQDEIVVDEKNLEATPGVTPTPPDTPRFDPDMH